MLRIESPVIRSLICIVQTATSNARSVGVIPALLGGGFSSISPIHGLGIDNLLSARVVTATHGLVVASPTENPDLFWALQGTGQAFGVVTEITVKLHPLSTLGAEDGKFWTFTFIYGQGQVQAVAETLERVSEKFPREIIGMALMAAPPPNFKVWKSALYLHRIGILLVNIQLIHQLIRRPSLQSASNSLAPKSRPVMSSHRSSISIRSTKRRPECRSIRSVTAPIIWTKKEGTSTSVLREEGKSVPRN